MAVIKFKQKGDLKKTERFFRKVGKGDIYKGLEEFGKEGVEALKKATPKDTGKTALSWRYSINKSKKGLTISWDNSNVNDGAHIAILIQYGHAMPSGYFVQGVDYINPALKPIFDKIGKQVWWEVTNNAYY